MLPTHTQYIKTSHLQRVTLIQKCITNDSGKIAFATVPGRPEYSSINKIVHNAVSGESQVIIEVDAAPFREVVGNKRVSLIFMDVEGAEQIVLESAKDIVSKDHPTIFCECQPLLLKKFGHTSATLFDELTSHGYKIFNARKNDKTSIAAPFEGDILAK